MKFKIKYTESLFHQFTGLSSLKIIASVSGFVSILNCNRSFCITANFITSSKTLLINVVCFCQYCQYLVVMGKRSMALYPYPCREEDRLPKYILEKKTLSKSPSNWLTTAILKTTTPCFPFESKLQRKSSFNESHP